MSCSRNQVDLSRCLDGRLPGTRRAEVMAHVDKCPKCNQVWEEMQTTQSLVFGLKQHQVTRSFRDDVWERIHSGEGSPEILLQEPITTLTKVRYGLIGAAAAAAFLFGVNLLTTDNSSPIENTPDPEVVEINRDTLDNETKDNTEKAPNAIESPVELVSGDLAAAGHLATQAIAKVASAANRLRIRKPVILRGKTDNQQLWQEVNQDVQTIDGGLHVLDSLQRNELVRLEPISRACMEAARNTLKTYRFDQHLQSINLVRTLDECSLDGLAKVQVTFSLPQFQAPQGLLFGIIADDPVLRDILTQLEILRPQGGVLVPPPMIQFVPGAAQHNMVLRIRPNMPPPQAKPKPVGAEKTLRKRPRKK